MSKPNEVGKQTERATRRKFSAEEKIRIVLARLRDEISMSELCRKEGIAASVYYKWSKVFLEAGKNARKHILQEFSIDENAKKLRRLINK